jgi:nicotinamidase-related amidase
MNATSLTVADSTLLVIDVQEKLIPLIHVGHHVVRNIGFLLDAAKTLGVPVDATEQYPRGLGRTIDELAERLPQKRHEKVAFSCCAVPEIIAELRSNGRPKVLLAGIETHVCIQNSALDLLACNFRVYIPVDAVGSRHPLDHDIALRRLQQAGAILTTSEAVVFEWLAGSSHPRFRAISALVKARMERKNEENPSGGQPQGGPK